MDVTQDRDLVILRMTPEEADDLAEAITVRGDRWERLQKELRYSALVSRQMWPVEIFGRTTD